LFDQKCSLNHKIIIIVKLIIASLVVWTKSINCEGSSGASHGVTFWSLFILSSLVEHQAVFPTIQVNLQWLSFNDLNVVLKEIMSKDSLKLNFKDV